MTDQIQDQEVELDEAAEVVDEAHDPKNAEAQSIDSVDKAAKAVTKQAPIPKTKSILKTPTLIRFLNAQPPFGLKHSNQLNQDFQQSLLISRICFVFFLSTGLVR